MKLLTRLVFNFAPPFFRFICCSIFRWSILVNILLNNDFEGDGTKFWNCSTNTTFHQLKPSQVGTLLTHPSVLSHEGMAQISKLVKILVSNAKIFFLPFDLYSFCLDYDYCWIWWKEQIAPIHDSVQPCQADAAVTMAHSDPMILLILAIAQKLHVTIQKGWETTWYQEQLCCS